MNPLRVLLDENLPTKLEYRFDNPLLFVSTIRDQNWLGKKNGELLRLMKAHQFVVLITNDKGIRYQQNKYTFSLFILQSNAASNRYDDLLPLVTKIEEVLIGLKDDIESNGQPKTLTTIDLE